MLRATPWYYALHQQLKVVSFNTLAPCYLRMKKYNARKDTIQAKPRLTQHLIQMSEASPSSNKSTFQQTPLESEIEVEWRSRIIKIIKLLQYINADIMALQEFWIENKEYVDLFQNAFTTASTDQIHYDLYLMQRPNHKQDGVATLVNTKKLIVNHTKSVNFNLQGNRVALLLDLECRLTGNRFIFANTHLTFPHHDYDRDHLRPLQATKLLASLQQFVDETGTKDVMIAGDFNTDIETRRKGMRSSDPILPLMLDKFNNTAISFDMATHLNHNNEIVGADYLFTSRNASSFSLVTPPDSKSIQLPPPDLEELVGMHLMQETHENSIMTAPQSYLFPMQYSSYSWFVPILDVSDHRPLIAHFQL